MTNPLRTFIGGALTAAILAACQTSPALKPAMLTPVNADAMTLIKAVLSDDLGRAQVDIFPADLTGQTGFSVRPSPLGPLETRSPAVPTQFRLATDGRTCFLINMDSSAQYALDGVTCTSADE